MQLSGEQHLAIRQAAADFKRSMEIRSSLNLRVARRVTAILRIGMVSFAVVAVLLIAMIVAFTAKMGDMLVALETMNQQFTSMAGNMTQMRETMETMNTHVALLPIIASETGLMTTAVGSLEGTVGQMAQEVNVIDGGLTHITRDVGQMTGNFRVLEPTVQGIGRNINQMSRPMKMFQQMMPMMP
ncbi:MAG: hypothetical protein HQL47_00940 [Gammaproteobacteria bacterium]|nr:hypothetical protein [Gammaproteobacteria bacterium]